MAVTYANIGLIYTQLATDQVDLYENKIDFERKKNCVGNFFFLFTYQCKCHLHCYFNIVEIFMRFHTLYISQLLIIMFININKSSRY